jgi:hypothetical protein
VLSSTKSLYDKTAIQKVYSAYHHSTIDEREVCDKYNVHVADEPDQYFSASTDGASSRSSVFI